MQNNSPVFVVMGVSGCGKSTIGKLLAKTFDIPFFDGDDYHPTANVQKMAAGIPLDDTDRKGWLQQLNILAIQHKNTGAVIACSALKASYRDILQAQLYAQMHFVYLKGSYDEIWARLKQRTNHFMPPNLLKSQFDTLEEPTDAFTVGITHPPEKIISIITNLYNQKSPD